MINHNPSFRKITYLLGFSGIIIGVLFIVFLLVYQYYYLPKSWNCERWMAEVIEPLALSGRIKDSRVLDDCHIILTLDPFGELKWCSCGGNVEITIPAIGDSLSKPAHSLTTTICSSPSLCATIHFPCCD